MTAAETALARAKVNLTLHLRGRRDDGYHLLDSLVVFPEIGDRVTVAPAAGLSLAVGGPFGAALGDDPDNLVLHAARGLAEAAGRPPRVALTLEKCLPVASGIGGGSSDAAVALDLLARHWGCAVPDGLALSLGADVPVCRAQPVPRRMRGIGERLDPVPGLPGHWVVLVNPGVGVATGAVFAGVVDRCPPPGPEMPDGGFDDFTALVAWLAEGRNDLEAPAVALCPVIGEVLAALSPAPLARMSGSGATCFALFPGRAEAEAMAARLSGTNWWVAAAPVALENAPAV